MRYLLLKLILFQTFSCFAQLNHNEEIYKRLNELNLPYKGLNIQLKRSIIDTNYLNIDQIVRNYVDSCEFEKEFYTCDIRFDNYTDTMLVNLSMGNDDQLFESIFIKSSIETDTAFIIDWLKYLDSCSYLPMYRDDFIKLRNTWIKFDLDKKGKIVLNNTVSKVKLLEDFLVNKRKWDIAVYNGRVLALTVELFFPYHYKYYSFNKYLKVHYMSPYLENVYFLWDIPDFDSRFNIISLISYYGRLVKPVIHSGNISNCEIILDRIKSFNKPMYIPKNWAQRIYFYSFLQ